MNFADIDINTPDLERSIIPLMDSSDEHARILLKAMIQKVKDDGGNFFNVLDFLIENGREDKRQNLRALVPQLDHLNELAFMSAQYQLMKRLVD